MATCSGPSDNDYYDILILGRTGQGKSTLGNKLLQPHSETPFATSSDNDRLKDQELSITKKVYSAINKTTKVRVLDTPGFADPSVFSNGEVDYHEANLRIFRSIVLQKDKLQVRRVVYFLPQRGILEKADAVLQSELRVMHHFFGDNIFNCMVLIATNQMPFQAVRLGEEQFKRSRHVFAKAMKFASGKSFPKCPPIVYIGIDDEAAGVLDKIQNAEVILEKIFILQFQNICLLCGVKIYYTQDDSGNPKPDTVKREEGKEEKYEESCCHPGFLPRSSMAEKIIGSLAHAATFGVPGVYEAITGNETWAGVDTFDELCVHCHRFPGTMGCLKVKTKMKMRDQEIIIDHTDKPDYNTLVSSK